ncbi:MAG TPA: aldo/keto reductase [Atopobiaceae bacterium]|nr:aldo/keto reductase [Atopobiaceae bacterium]
MSNLGFGLMRLPRRGLMTDIGQTCTMVDMFLEAGFTYFDTALIYVGSEDATRKALVHRHPRESFTVATKLNASVAPTEASARKQVRTSLKRMGADYIDYYLLHSVMSGNRNKYDRMGLWDYARQLKREGTIRHWGFSYHDGPDLLDELLTLHPDAEFVQLQINYADWESPTVHARANYEVARAHGKQIVIMEPVKGGKLANPPAEVARILKAANPDASPASWAIRFAASLDGVLAVLSGMSNIEQMADNLSFMRNFKPLDAAERATIRQAQAALGASGIIQCTECSYCTAGCPQEIPIPAIFSAMNEHLGNGQNVRARELYAQATSTGNPASACIACGQCEAACPQHLPIIDLLASCAKTLE